MVLHLHLRKHLEAEGDQGCFFFEDIARLLIEQGKIGFQINNYK